MCFVRDLLKVPALAKSNPSRFLWQGGNVVPSALKPTIKSGSKSLMPSLNQSDWLKSEHRPCCSHIFFQYSRSSYEQFNDGQKTLLNSTTGLDNWQFFPQIIQPHPTSHTQFLRRAQLKLCTTRQAHNSCGKSKIADSINYVVNSRN
jgi:hypothetical protein